MRALKVLNTIFLLLVFVIFTLLIYQWGGESKLREIGEGLVNLGREGVNLLLSFF